MILNILTEHEFKVEKIRKPSELIVSSISTIIVASLYELLGMKGILDNFIKITLFSILRKLAELYLFKVGIKDSLLLISSTFLAIILPLIFHVLISGRETELESMILEIRELYDDVNQKRRIWHT